MTAPAYNIFSTNNLKNIEQFIWDFFQQGVKNKKSAFHYPTIATGSEKSFNLRTVVLRKVIREDKIVVFHSDIRSKKITELKSSNKLLLHIYDKKNKVQIQAEGKAKIFYKEKINNLIWNSLSNNTKSVYLVNKTPGKKIANQKDFKNLTHDEGYENFAIIKVKIYQIIFLQLSHSGNKKALFKYLSKNNKYFWLVP